MEVIYLNLIFLILNALVSFDSNFVKYHVVFGEIFAIIFLI